MSEEEWKLKYQVAKKERASSIKDIIPNYIFGRFSKIEQKVSAYFFISISGNQKDSIFRDIYEIENSLKKGYFYESDLMGQIVGRGMFENLQAFEDNYKLFYKLAKKILETDPTGAFYWLSRETSRENTFKALADDTIFENYAKLSTKFLDKLYEHFSELSKAKIQETLKSAEKWFAAESKYLNELKQNLEDIKKETDTRKEWKSSSKLEQVFRYVSRCQVKGEKAAEKIIEELKKRPDLAQLEQELEIETGKLLKAFSFYSGQFREDLNKISLRISEKMAKEEIDNILKDEESKINNLVEGVEEKVVNLIKWIASLEATLKNIDKAVE